MSTWRGCLQRSAGEELLSPTKLVEPSVPGASWTTSPATVRETTEACCSLLVWSKGRRPPGARATFIRWTGWTLAVTVPRWQHRKRCRSPLLLLLLGWWLIDWLFAAGAVCVNERRYEHVDDQRSWGGLGAEDAASVDLRQQSTVSYRRHQTTHRRNTRQVRRSICTRVLVSTLYTTVFYWRT